MRDSVRVNRHPANAKFLRQIALFSDRAKETRGDKRQATQKKERRVRKQIKEKGKRRFRLFTCPWNIVPLMRVSMATTRLFFGNVVMLAQFLLKLALVFSCRCARCTVQKAYFSRNFGGMLFDVEAIKCL